MNKNIIEGTSSHYTETIQPFIFFNHFNQPITPLLCVFKYIQLFCGALHIPLATTLTKCKESIHIFQNRAFASILGFRAASGGRMIIVNGL